MQSYDHLVHIKSQVLSSKKNKKTRQILKGSLCHIVNVDSKIT